METTTLRRIAILALLFLACPATALGDLTASPSKVKFGAAPLHCFLFGGVNNIPPPPCPLKTITITNTGTTVAPLAGFSACDRLFLSDAGDSCEGSFWGGFVGGPPLTTCSPRNPLPPELSPGESCQVTLVAAPRRKGGIHGFAAFFALDSAGNQRYVLVVPVFVRGVSP